MIRGFLYEGICRKIGFGRSFVEDFIEESWVGMDLEGEI
jgi:hypothetical protein